MLYPGVPLLQISTNAEDLQTSSFWVLVEASSHRQEAWLFKLVAIG